MKYNLFQLRFAIPLFFLSCAPGNPSGPQTSRVSMTGNWIPSTSYFQEYTVSGNFVLDTTFNMHDYLASWGIRKYVKIDSNLVTVYTTGSGEILVDTTHYQYCRECDSIEIVSSFHSSDSIKTEYIIQENGKVFITADMIMNDAPSFRVIYKTRLEKYDGPMPNPT